MLALTDRFKFLVSTQYSAARSESSITLRPRISHIFCFIGSNASIFFSFDYAKVRVFVEKSGLCIVFNFSFGFRGVWSQPASASWLTPLG